MALTQTELESRAIELSTEAFDAFCDDISGMFEVDMKCASKEVSEETVNGLKKRFKKLAAISNVDTTGAMHGRFYLVFDQGGLFTLSGVIVMLPEKRIIQEIRRGTIQDVDSMNDAVGETGNLLVGSWDRVFREEYEGHGHFVQDGTFIGNPWDNPEESINLKNDESIMFVPFEMTVGNYPTFNCGVIFPKSIFEPQAELQDETNETEEKIVENAENENTSLENKETEIIDKEVSQTNEEIAETVVLEEKPVSENTSDNQNVKPVSETIKKMTESPAVLPGQTASVNIDNTSDNIQQNTKSELTSLSINAKSIMDNNVTWCSPDESVQQAIDKMQQFDTSYLIVGNNGVLEGIVSRSDITGAISPYLKSIFSKWRRPLDDATLNIKIKWIMTRPVQTIKPEITISKIMENMKQHGIRCFPVVNSKGNVEGIVTVFDIFKALGSNPDISTMGKTMQVPLLI